jgi:hypothetical protein
MGFERLLRTDVGRYLLSAVLGFGAATLLFGVCGQDCTTKIAAAPSRKPSRYGGKCWLYEHEAEPCDSSRDVYDFA